MDIDIQKTIHKARTRRILYLTPAEHVSYLGYGLGFLAGAVYFLYDYVLDFLLTGGFFDPSTKEITGMIAVALFAIYVIVRRGTRRFEVVNTTLPRGELVSLIRELCEDCEITPMVFDKDMLVLEFVPDGLDKGQRVTIVFDTGRVLINSITRPKDIDNRTKMVSIGENSLNLEIFRDEIRDREREYLAAVNRENV